VNFSSSAVGLALPSYAAHAASKSASDAPVLERPIAAADIANLVAFLVSEDGCWVDGRVIRGRMASSVAKPRVTDQGFRRVRGTARSATLIRSISAPGGQHGHH